MSLVHTKRISRYSFFKASLGKKFRVNLFFQISLFFKRLGIVNAKKTQSALHCPITKRIWNNFRHNLGTRTKVCWLAEQNASSDKGYLKEASETRSFTRWFSSLDTLSGETSNDDDDEAFKISNVVVVQGHWDKVNMRLRTKSRCSISSFSLNSAF